MVYPNRVVLNINQKYVMPIPYTQQGDTARVLTFNILDKGVPFNLTGKTVRAKIVKPDNTKCYNDLTITNATGGECDLKLTNQVLAVAGKVNCQLEIKEGDELLSTIIFTIDVEPSIDINGAVESTNEFTALLNGIIKLDEWDKYFKETSGAIEEKYTERLNGIDSSLEEIKNEVSDKVDKVEGETLTPNKYTTDDKNKVELIPTLAPKDYVDLKTQANNLSYKESYATLELLKSAYPNGDNYNHVVLSDDLIYTFVNDSWISTGVQANANGVADDTITLDKIPSNRDSVVNDVSIWELGSISTAGVEVADTKRARCKFVNVAKGTVVKSIGDISIMVLIYDENDKFIKSIGTFSKKTIINEECSNMRLSCKKDDNTEITDLNAISNSIVLYNSVTKDIAFSSINYLNLDESINNQLKPKFKNWEIGAIESSNGLIVESDKRLRISDFLLSDEGQYITHVSGMGVQHIVLLYNDDLTFNKLSSPYNGNKEYITSKYYKVVLKYSDDRVITKDNIQYLIDNTIIPNKRFTNENLGYGCVEQQNIKSKNIIPNHLSDDVFSIFGNNLGGKILLGFGDSIFAGDGNDGVGIGDIISKQNNMNLHDYSKSGATITVKTKNENDIVKQVNKAISEVESVHYILIEGGTNDATQLTADVFGTISEGYNSELDVNTFCGAFEYCIKSLRLKYLNAKIIYIRCHNMSSRDERQITLGNLAIQMCEKWSIPYVDLYKEGGLNTQISEMVGVFTPPGDRTHPNKLGYETFYIPPIENKMKSI